MTSRKLLNRKAKRDRLEIAHQTLNEEKLNSENHFKQFKLINTYQANRHQAKKVFKMPSPAQPKTGKAGHFYTTSVTTPYMTFGWPIGSPLRCREYLSVLKIPTLLNTHAHSNFFKRICIESARFCSILNVVYYSLVLLQQSCSVGKVKLPPTQYKRKLRYRASKLNYTYS